jgi:hypothetical protein
VVYGGVVCKPGTPRERNGLCLAALVVLAAMQESLTAIGSHQEEIVSVIDEVLWQLHTEAEKLDHDLQGFTVYDTIG